MHQYTRKELSWLIQACDDYLNGIGRGRHTAGFCYFFDKWCEDHEVAQDDPAQWDFAYSLVGALRQYPGIEEEFGASEYVDGPNGPTERRREFVAALRKLAEELL